jgi:hypothetical protein
MGFSEATKQPSKKRRKITVSFFVLLPTLLGFLLYSPQKCEFLCLPEEVGQLCHNISSIVLFIFCFNEEM